jgi:hypothetical protein
MTIDALPSRGRGRTHPRLSVPDHWRDQRDAELAHYVWSITSG